MDIRNIIPGTKSIVYLFDHCRHALSILDRSILISQEYPLDPNKIANLMDNPNMIKDIKVSISNIYPGRYIILDGYHRFTAAVALELTEIQVIIIN